MDISPKSLWNAVTAAFCKSARTVRLAVCVAAGFLRKLPKAAKIGGALFLAVLAVSAAALLLRHFFLPVDLSGIDVSHYQGKINWRLVSKNGQIKFAYIKATEGSTYRDPNFNSNWKKALRCGITVGAYHFFSPKSPGSTQAENYIATVPNQHGRLTPVVDVENTALAEGKYKAQLALFIRRVEAHYGQRPMFYVPYRVYSLLKDEYAGYPFWVVDYKSSPQVTGWTLWQYSSTGSVAGITGSVDLDRYRGPRWSFLKLIS